MHAPFVEQRLSHLLASSEDFSARVVAPVPWFPFSSPRFGQYAVFNRVPREEARKGVKMYHPRYPVIPKVGMSLAPFLMAAWTLPTLKKIIKSGFDFDVIDAHFLYPDGIAAVLLGRMLNKPVVITCRGSDVTLHQNFRLPRAITRHFIKSADALITVCEALKQDLTHHEFELPAVTVLRNGVDLALFKEVNRGQVRNRLGLSGTVLISVGRLAELKGQDLTIEALQHLPDTRLVLVGDGPFETALRATADKFGVADRVIFAGGQVQQALPDYYSAADIMVLASSREGWANVLLESMACGTPVVATNVGGTPEVLGKEDAGVLVKERNAEGIAEAVKRLLADYPSREKVRGYAEQFDWSATSMGQQRIFEQVLSKYK